MYRLRVCAVCDVQFQPQSSNAKRCEECRRLKWVANIGRLALSDREYRNQYERTCAHCESPFTTWNRSGRYCTPQCRTKASVARRSGEPSHWLNKLITCGICQKEFIRPATSSPIRKYCSAECSLAARSRSRQRFAAANPEAMQNYNRTRTKRYGHDTLINRLRKVYPDLPSTCQAAGCDEGRVLEISHRPEYKRNGAWRAVSNCQPHMIWLLCPTCHRVLDLGIETASQLGLP